MTTNSQKWQQGTAWLSVLGCLMGFLLASTAQAQTTKDQMLSLLQGYEWRLEPVRFTTLANADLVLMEIAEDASLMNVYRFRALAALQLFPKDRVADFLENYIAQNPTSSHSRRALEALSAGFSESHPKRVSDTAQKLLQDPNPHVRISAARTLKALDTPKATSAYRVHLNKESEDWVRQAIRE